MREKYCPGIASSKAMVIAIPNVHAQKLRKRQISAGLVVYPQLAPFEVTPTDAVNSCEPPFSKPILDEFGQNWILFNGTTRRDWARILMEGPGTTL